MILVLLGSVYFTEYNGTSWDYFVANIKIAFFLMAE